MDKGCRVVGCDELPVVEASVIVSRVTDVAKNEWQHNQLSCNKATRDAKCFVGKNHIVTQPFMYRDKPFAGATCFVGKKPHRRVTTCRGWLQPEHVNHSLQKRASARGHYEEITGGQRVRLWSLAKDNYSRGQGGAFIIRQVV